MQENQRSSSEILKNVGNLRILSLTTILWFALLFNLHAITIDNREVLDLNVISFAGLAFIGLLSLLFPNIAHTSFIVVFLPIFVLQQAAYFIVPIDVETSKVMQIVTDGLVMAITLWFIQRLSQQIIQAEDDLRDYILDEYSHILLYSVAQHRLAEELDQLRQISQPMSVIYCQVYNEDVVPSETDDSTLERVLHNQLDINLKNRYSQVQLARHILNLTYSTDIVFEYMSGIVVCLPETNRDNAKKFLDQLSGFIRKNGNMTLWTGLAIFPLDASTVDELIRKSKDHLKIYIGPEELDDDVPRSGDVSVTISDRLRIAEKSAWVNNLANQSKQSRAIYRPVKRFIDIVASGFGLLLISPFLAGIAIAVYLDDGWPIFYSHKRVGLGGKTFKMHKFRSMYRNAPKLEPKIIQLSDGSIRYDWPDKDEDDPRITRVGQFLRKTSLDELPQLWNVFIGDMSLVGPRPSSWTLDQHTLHQTARLTVKPGITGLWQVSARSSKNFDERLLWDLKYVEKIGFWLDIRILLMTFRAVVKRSGI